MIWSPQQDAALTAVGQFMQDPAQQVFYLAGYAGTGKTSLARHFATGIDGIVAYGAFTGKAAYVMRQKGCDGATTLHSLIYISQEKSKAKLRELEHDLGDLLYELQQENAANPEWDPNDNQTVRILKAHIIAEETALKRPIFVLNQDSAVKDAKLLIIDECSMVDEQMGQDLMSFGVKILVLGDPGQLPPVFGSGYFTSQKPDFMLTEVHRQAQDNPILWMATRVREGKSIGLGKYGESSVINVEDLNVDDVVRAGQLLVGRNDTRRDSNVRMRKLKQQKDGDEYDVYPIAGDRLVCLRNNHERGLLNGAIWYVEEAGSPNEDCIGLSVRPEDGGDSILVNSHTHYFEKRGDKLPWYDRKNAEEFDYGYALTVHKSQGSQWDNVMLFDESFSFKEYRAKWLYTGITRAAEKLTLVRM